MLARVRISPGAMPCPGLCVTENVFMLPVNTTPVTGATADINGPTDTAVSTMDMKRGNIMATGCSSTAGQTCTRVATWTTFAVISDAQGVHSQGSRLAFGCVGGSHACICSLICGCRQDSKSNVLELCACMAGTFKRSRYTPIQPTLISPHHVFQAWCGFRGLR